ncbi:hypothetical protein FRX31_023894 [Thalictrum thalictroides]|uniref:Transposase Tnp1/En/Spm-like domain-containing protein n=1 Tax=Thalictrum thalictroides TaxID=46969 RepID=A0A7J6VPP0_THATH|nr:hypothetical protein FRX31_023894 [Thalictrum thalictroides]
MLVVHGIPLGQENAKVRIDKVLDENALLPIPFGDYETVQSALFTFAPGQKRFIIETDMVTNSPNQERNDIVQQSESEEGISNHISEDEDSRPASSFKISGSLYELVRKEIGNISDMEKEILDSGDNISLLQQESMTMLLDTVREEQNMILLEYSSTNERVEEQLKDYNDLKDNTKYLQDENNNLKRDLPAKDQEMENKRKI